MMPFKDPIKEREYRRKYTPMWREKNREKFLEKHRLHNRKWYDRNGLEYERNRDEKKRNAKNRLNGSLHLYPLDDKCVFCDRTENLEHGHIDYNYPRLYLTVCHQCNC